jgi:hypothetical protein
MTFICKYIVCGVAVAAVEGLNLNRMMNGKQPSREANPDFDNLRITMEGAFQEAHRVLEQQPRPVNPTGSASLVAEVLADGTVTAAEGQDLVSKLLRQEIPQRDVQGIVNGARDIKEQLLAEAAPVAPDKVGVSILADDLFKNSPDARQQLRQRFKWDFPVADGQDTGKSEAKKSWFRCRSKRASEVFESGVANTGQSCCDSSEDVPGVFVSNQYADEIPGPLSCRQRWQLKSLLKIDTEAACKVNLKMFH